MKSLKEQIEADVADIAKSYQIPIYQARTIAWAEYWENKLAAIEARYQGNFDPGYIFDCYCFTCKTGNAFGSPDSMRLFVLDHKGHKTKCFKRR